MLIGFAPLPYPVRFDDGAERLLARMPAYLRGWDHEPVEDSVPAFAVSRTIDGWRIDAPWHDAPIVEPGDFRATAHLAVDLIEAWLAAHPDRLALHCASALFDGKLFLFPGRARAGKSTLAARLAAEGWAIFSDDLLALSADGLGGLSLGQSPRVRLPLPAGLAALDALVASQAGARDADYAYLNLDEPLAPTFGRSAPIGGICLLDRRVTGPAHVSPAAPGDGMASLLMQILSPELAAADALPALGRLLRNIPCFTLTYCDLDEAVACLSEGLLALPDPVRADRPKPQSRPQASLAERRFRACAKVRLHQAGDEAFLVDPDSDAVFRLNLLSLGLWNLLQQPTGRAEAEAILSGAFPEANTEDIRTDVAAFFEAMTARGLVRPVADA